MISGGVKVNVVPESCTAEVDMRIPAGITSSKIKRRLEELLEEEGLGDVGCELLLESDPNYTAPNQRVCTVLKENVREVMGVDVAPIIVTGGSDGRYFRLKGIPTVCYGPGEVRMAHAYNEYVLVDELLDATKVIADTVADFITQPVR
jgi:succinyl-diaminopimelate desuccinylase